MRCDGGGVVEGVDADRAFNTHGAPAGVWLDRLHAAAHGGYAPDGALARLLALNLARALR